MSDDLVERVGRELARTGYAFAGIEGLTDPYTADADYWNSQARAAIALALEEAAKVCEPKGDCSEMDAYGKAYAAAIRAMTPQEDK